MLAEHRQNLTGYSRRFHLRDEGGFQTFRQGKIEEIVVARRKSVVHFETPQKSTGLLGSKEIPQLLRTLGYNPTETEVVFPRGPKSLNFPDGNFQRAKTFRTKCVNRFRDKKSVRKFFL